MAAFTCGCNRALGAGATPDQTVKGVSSAAMPLTLSSMFTGKTADKIDYLFNTYY
ncbi:hypothetical protein [Janthinobacterium sp. 1_2014MBL_MicDiv]|uniref:hypothetical protein n=1 Tax=Janthinobacterium sp. 1_2014MBL_MicDiv TaxID=1644131 RepID=UPI0012EB776B|nr:hypothetical protein [Janthinobacterium sp. 1_2014MBL_MicDiv]